MISLQPIRGEPFTLSNTANESLVTLAPGLKLPEPYLRELQAKGRRIFIHAVTDFVLKPYQHRSDLQPFADDGDSGPDISDSDQEQNEPVQAQPLPRIGQSINIRLRSGYVLTLLCDSRAIHELRSGRRISYQPELVSLRRY